MGEESTGWDHAGREGLTGRPQVGEEMGEGEETYIND